MAKRKKKRKVRKKPFTARKKLPFPEIDANQLFDVLVNSDYLIEEPEFEEFIFDHREVLDTFRAASADLNYQDVSPSEEEEEEEFLKKRDELFIEILARLMTEEHKREIRARAMTLCKRFAREGRKKDFLMATAVRSFIDTEPEADMWYMVGLIRAMLYRHLKANMAVAQLTEAIEEEIGSIESFASLADVLEATSQKGVEKKAAGILDKVPGLSKMLAKTADKVWEEGYDAISSGELNLGLFEKEEKQQLVRQLSDSTVRDENDELSITSEKAEQFIQQMIAYVDEIYSPERLAEIRRRIEKATNSHEVDQHWKPFLLLLAQDFKDEELRQEHVKGFLVQALFGEIWALDADLAAADDEA